MPPDLYIPLTGAKLELCITIVVTETAHLLLHWSEHACASAI